MLAFLGTSIGKYLLAGIVIVALIGSWYLYIEHEQSTIATLTANNAVATQANTDLQTAQTKTNADVAANAQATDTANQQINTANTAAATAEVTVTQSVKQIGKTPSTANAAKINSDFTALLNGIGEASK